MKGLLILLGIIASTVIFCGVVPFVVMPGAGISMALPVISVPGEKLWEDFLGVDGLTVTNTLIGTLLADVVLLAFAIGATRTMRDVPGRLQGLFEVVTDALYSLAKSTAGANARKIFPLMATIFLFLLVANWIELVPGVDSVGLMHCAEDGVNGYPKDGVTLKVDEPLDAGTRATEADYEACYAKEHDDGEHAAEGEATAAAAGENSGEEDTAARDDLYVVTSFVRAAATDLNLTLGLAVLAVLAVQYFGIRALGLGYFAKFINIPALDKIDREPMGAMDFAVGFLEIISEISRIISFGFRLFGNIFAGQVLLFVIPFLAGALMPLAVYGFEVFVGVLQAFVFSMLLLVFATMAMTSHSHDDSH
ncbi:MAG: F0F1 ATP synthase subunit A [Anaerolineae bacterium]|nr:F0F1 ATP synthase subunit A [Anaerolineae bacterium]